jgi:hypothetical protein
MGKDALGTLIMIGVAIYAPYLAASIGLKGLAATAFSFVLQAGASFLVKEVLGPGGSGGSGSVADSGVLVNKTGSVNSIPVVYGTRRVGGTRIYLETTNASGDPAGTEYLHIAMALAQGGVLSAGTDAIRDVTQIIFNDRVAWTSTGGVTSHFAGLLDVAVWTGEATQLLSGWRYNTQSDFNWRSDDWTSAHRCRGVAWLYVRLKYDRDVYPGAPTILADVSGKRIQSVENLGVYTNSLSEMRNPANILYDYLTSVRYGKGLNPADIDVASFVAARSWCFAAQMRINGALDTSDTVFNNVQKILSCSNLNLVYVNGKYSVQPLKQESFTNAFVFNTSNIIGQWTISLGSKKTRFNQAVVNFFNPRSDSSIIGEQWQPDSIQVTNNTYLSADSGVVNEKSFDLPLVADAGLAQRITNFLINNSRYQTIVNFTAVHSALQLQVGDPVLVTHPVPGWTNEKFRVNSVTLQADSTVDIVLEQYAPDSIYLENNI